MFETLKALISGPASQKPSRPGSEADAIRQLLFASQSLREQVSRMHLDGKPGPFHTIADAAALVDRGEPQQAIASLRGLLESPDLETRVQLWVWSALRELAQKPEGKLGFEVLGVVLEMPQGGAFDTLAAYVDGSARYLNYSGRAIFWDAPDAAIKRLCQGLVDSTIPASRSAKPRNSLALPKRGNQATMLTRSGPYVIVRPPEAVIAAGAALMLELIKRVQQPATA